MQPRCRGECGEQREVRSLPRELLVRLFRIAGDARAATPGDPETLADLVVGASGMCQTCAELFVLLIEQNVEVMIALRDGGATRDQAEVVVVARMTNSNGCS